jgi:hypothetical protein
MADADYSFQLATLIKAQLKPTLKVYVEWSNETWNGGFQQSQYAYDQGNALGLDSDPWSAAFKYHVYAAVRVFAQFDKVFGATGAQLVKVLAGQTDNNWMTGIHIAALGDAKINPLHVTANAYAVAPYFGHGVNGNAGDAITQLYAAVKSVTADVKAQYDVVSKSGLQLLAYEGGQHVLNGADVVNARPEMYQVYTQYLDAMAPYFTLFTHYCHSGSWNSGGAWGAEQSVNATGSAAYKYRAIVDWVARH